MSNGKYAELCEYLSERNPDCFHYIIAVTKSLDEAYLDVVNRVYESAEDAKVEARKVLLKIIIKMIEDEGQNATEYLIAQASKITDTDKECTCEGEKCVCEDKLLCEEHPKYQGIRKPRKECDKCWEIYRIKNPDKV